MRTKDTIWFWHGVWVVSLLVGLGVFMLYAWLPADGATGDLESFIPEGFRVQWLLEEREGGLRVGDVIVRAGGHTVDEWLEGAPRGAEWRSGGVVPYEILRDEQPATLQIRLAPIPFRAILARWAPQLLGALAFFTIGTFVFWKRPQELAARLLMFFCVTVSLHHWGDAYNFQYTTLPWRWPLWFQLAYEHAMYSLSLATICYFALVFPVSHPLVKRFPRLAPFVLYASHLVAISGAMVLSPAWNAALQIGNHASWIISMIQVGVGVGAGIRSARTARDPVTRTQVRWMLWSGGVAVAILVPGYVLPLVFGRRPLIPHPATMIFIALIPFSLAIAILRYRLFDIEVIINRTLVYGTLTAFLGGLYLLLVRLLTLVAQAITPAGNETLVVFVATLAIALAFAPLRQRVQGMIDRAFYRTKLDYQRMLSEMSAQLSTNIVLERLVPLLTEELPHRLQIARASLLVLDPEGQTLAFFDDEGGTSLPVGHPLLRSHAEQHLPNEASAFLQGLLQGGVELSIPLIVGQRLVGVYNLGAKLSGIPYTRDEVRLLTVLGQQAAVSVENARLYQDIEEYSRTLEQKVEQRTAELTTVNEQLRQEVAERKRAEEIIKHLAYHDSLTGLPNRRLFNDRLNLAMAHAHRSQEKLAVMLLDLDHFKDVNDTLGHSVGDQLLQVVGGRLTSLLRKSDTVARMGGDEFMLLLPEIAGGEDAVKIAQKILEAFRKPFVFDDHELHTTTSVGIAFYSEDGEDGDTLMKNADIAMYRAKEQGRDNYQRYTSTAR